MLLGVKGRTRKEVERQLTHSTPLLNSSSHNLDTSDLTLVVM